MAGKRLSLDRLVELAEAALESEVGPATLPELQELAIGLFSAFLPVFFTNGAIYLRPKSLIKTYKSGGWQLGNKPGYVVMDEFESVNIDSNFDFIYAKAVLDYLDSVTN